MYTGRMRFRLGMILWMFLLVLAMGGCSLFRGSSPFESNEDRVHLRKADNSYNCLTFALTNNHEDEDNPGFSAADNPAHDFLVCCISLRYGCGGL